MQLNSAVFRQYQFQSEALYFGSTQKNRFILMPTKAKLRQGLGVLRRYRRYYRERGNRTAVILDLSIKDCFIKIHLKFINASLEDFLHIEILWKTFFQEHSGSLVFLILELFILRNSCLQFSF